MLDPRQGADLICQHLDGPIRRIPRVLGIIRQLPPASHDGIRIVHAGPTTSRQHRRIAARNLDEFHGPLDLRIYGHDLDFVVGVRTAELRCKRKIPIGVTELGISVQQGHGIQRHQLPV